MDLSDRVMVEACKLTRIDANMGVLMIHQKTSVFSIISQHLVKAGNNINTQEGAADSGPLSLEVFLTQHRYSRL